MAKKIPNTKLYVLDNGMKILTEKISEVRSVSVGIIVGTGSGAERENESGISHFIEHMMFKGTPTRTSFQIAQELDSIGGRINAYTGKEYTCYYAVVLDRHVDVAVDVLSDIFLNSKIAAEEIDLERKVVLEEISMYEDTPDELIHDFFAETILHGHPLSRNTLGTVETVNSFTRNDIIKFQNRYYHPDNILISIAGNFDPSKAIKEIEKKFKHLSGKRAKDEERLHKIIPSIKYKTKKTEQVHFCVGTKGVSQLDENRYTFAILDNILGGCLSSRLFQEVREKRGLAYSIFSYNSSFKNIGIFCVYAGVSKKNMKEVLDITLKEFKNVKKDGITEEELSRGKEFIKGSLVLSLENTSSRMSYNSKSELYYNRVITIDEIFNEINRVAVDDVAQAANHYLNEKYLNLAVIGEYAQGEEPVKSLSC